MKVEPKKPVPRRIGRNDPCWCGRKKYKNCQLAEDQRSGAGAKRTALPYPSDPWRYWG